MAEYVDLSERVIATFYSDEYEEWTQQTVTIADVLDSVCDDYTILPSTQPERKPGHWETYIISMLDGDGCRCSECGFEGVPYWNFCPNCGADMRGEE